MKNEKMKIAKYKNDQIASEIKDNYDMFLCCTSFEERCLTIPTELKCNYIKEIAILHNEDFDDYSYANTCKLLEMYEEKAKLIEISTRKPILTFDSIRSIIMGKRSSILVDITTFTHESLVMLYKVISENLSKLRNVTFLYTNAAEYSSGARETEKWLSRGIREIRSVVGYPGKSSPIKRDYLILIVGYEYNRSLEIVDFLQPSLISLGYGRSSTATSKKNRSANEKYKSILKQLLSNYPELDEFEITCNDPYSAVQSIEEKVKIHDDKNIILIPMNNKITTIACAMAAEQDERIQIVYAPAVVYNYKNYSKPGRSIYLMEIK